MIFDLRVAEMSPAFFISGNSFSTISSCVALTAEQKVRGDWGVTPTSASSIRGVCTHGCPACRFWNY